MKLVTGIEAIQSGKLIKRPGGIWFLPGDEDTFSAKEMRTPCFEIKPESREFWLLLNKCGVFRAWRDSPPDADSVAEWIKVREVLDET